MTRIIAGPCQNTFVMLMIVADARAEHLSAVIFSGR